MLDIAKPILKRFWTTDARSGRMYKNTFAMLGIRGGSIFISLISAPIMLHHVERADYGVLMTLTSIVNWIGLMDIGLGNGLRNKIPEYLAKGEFDRAKQVVSSCYAALGLYICLIIGAFFLLIPHVNMLQVLNSPGSDYGEITMLTCIIFVSFCFQFLLGLINSILFAYQMPAFQSLFVFVGQILALAALIVQIYVFDITSVLYIGAANCLIPPLVLLVASICLFTGRLREICPSLSCIRLTSVGGILSLGIKFFVLQIITIVLFQANSIIIAQSVGQEAVVEYNLAFKYVSVITMVFNIVIAPIWSATTDAYIRDDMAWIRKTIRYSNRVCLGTIVLGMVMVLVSKSIYGIWLGAEHINISYTTTLLVFAFVSFEMLYKVYGTVINGTGKIRLQMIVTGIIAIAYIPIAYNMGTVMGLSGVLMANVIVFVLNYLWARIQCNKLINKTAVGIWDR